MTKLSIFSAAAVSFLMTSQPVVAEENNLTTFVGAIIEKAVLTTSAEIQKSINLTVANAMSDLNLFSFENHEVIKTDVNQTHPSVTK